MSTHLKTLATKYISSMWGRAVSAHTININITGLFKLSLYGVESEDQAEAGARPRPMPPTSAQLCNCPVIYPLVT